MAPRVLIVDDSPEMTDTVARYLSVRGFTTRVARSGDEALALAEATPFDAVVTDLRMTGLDGLDVLAGLKTACPDVPVILMTAFGSVRTAVEAIQRGAYDYLTKPFALADLRALLERAVAARAALEEKAPPVGAASGPSQRELRPGAEETAGPSREESPPWQGALDTLARHRLPLTTVTDAYVEAIVRDLGSKAKAAEILGVDPSTIYRRQRKQRG